MAQFALVGSTVSHNWQRQSQGGGGYHLCERSLLFLLDQAEGKNRRDTQVKVNNIRKGNLIFRFLMPHEIKLETPKLSVTCLIVVAVAHLSAAPCELYPG